MSNSAVTRAARTGSVRADALGWRLMSSLSDLLAARTSLDDAQVSHVQRLVGEWQLIADLSFSDLLLWAPGADGSFLCVAQCRPTTGPTAYVHDQVGVVIRGGRATPMRVALTEGRIYREADPDWDGDLPIRREAIPVRLGGAVIAVLGRDSNLASVRPPSQLERRTLASLLPRPSTAMTAPPSRTGIASRRI